MPQNKIAPGTDVTALMNGGQQQQQPVQSGQDVTAQMNQAPPLDAVTRAASKAETIRGPLTWGEWTRQNLPSIAGFIGGTAGLLSGIGTIPTIGLAGLSAAGGKGYQDVWRHSQGLPTPPTELDAGLGMVEEGITSGVIPEVVGQGFGRATRFGGDLLAQRGANKKNAALIERTVNPRNRTMSPSASEVGKPIQQYIRGNKAAAEAPIKQGYDEELSGPFGQARKFELKDEKLGVLDEAAGEVGPIEFSFAESGPSIAQRHTNRSQQLETGRRMLKDRDPELRRQGMEAVKAADQELQNITEIAQQHGLSPDRYMGLSQAWRAVQDQYGNKFVNQGLGKTGHNFIDMLTKPGTWKSFKVTKEGVAERTDQPDLLRALKSAVNDPDAWMDLQTAVQKNIVRKAYDPAMDQINPNRLASLIKNMIDGGAKDLVPAHKELTEFAQTLAQHADSVKGTRWDAMLLGAIGGGTLAAQQGFDNTGIATAAFGGAAALRGYSALKGLGVPDLSRAKMHKAGKTGIGEKLMSLLGRISAYGAKTVLEEEFEQDRQAAGMMPEPPLGR